MDLDNFLDDPDMDAIVIPFRRADGRTVCKDCGKEYLEHPMETIVLSAIDNQPFLHVLCDGSRVKL
jgi:hypothetical protein